jgi:magnesium transporter
VRIRLLKPRELAARLLDLARRRPAEVEEYLDSHGEEWEALAGANPHDVADILEELGEEAATELLTDLPPAEAAEVLEEMRTELAADILEVLSAEAAADLLEVMDTSEAADLLAEVEPTVRNRLIAELEEEFAGEVLELLAYSPDSAGGIMTTEIAALPVGMSAGEAIEAIRRLHDELEDLSYVYVVDERERLLGVLSFRDLVFNRPGVGLDEVMVADPIAVAADTDRGEVAELIQRYHLFGLPVVDGSRRLLGMVTTEAAIEAVQEEASEDFAVAVGAGAEETVHTPVPRSIRSRLPWISFDVVISSVVVVAISRFSGILEQFTVLAALMPLVARIGGDAGAQSLAVVIRGLASDDISSSANARVIRRETLIGALNGVAIALLAGILGYTLQTIRGGPDPLQIGLAMTIAAWSNLLIAGMAGAGIPLALRALGFDPALGSNLFLTTVTDLLGFAGFLAVASALLT